MVQDLTFSTTVSGHAEHGMELRGVPLDELIAKADFVSTLYLSLTGKQPTEGQKKLLNAILVASLDHGINPASGFVPRVVTASGNDVLTAMASTLLALGPYHGGALTPAMEVFARIDAEGKTDVEAAALALIKEYRQQKKRVPGFGHPHYTDQDPRAQQLFAMAREAQLPERFMDIALTVETLLEQELARKLVLNIDGAIAALFATFDFEPRVGNALFGLARVAGSIAHIAEEQASGNWVRRLADAAVSYQPPSENK